MLCTHVHVGKACTHIKYNKRKEKQYEIKWEIHRNKRELLLSFRGVYDVTCGVSLLKTSQWSLLGVLWMVLSVSPGKQRHLNSFPILNGSFYFFLILLWKMCSWKIILTLELGFLPLFQGGQALFSQNKWKIRKCDTEKIKRKVL